MDELKGIQYSTPLSSAFFSAQNMDSIQTNIRYHETDWDKSIFYEQLSDYLYFMLVLMG